MHEELVIPARFNGPPESGNGGYSCGVIAAYIEGPARVRLHAPPPLDTRLRVAIDEHGAVALYDDNTLVGSGSSAALELEVPPAPSLSDARVGMGNYPAYHDHNFATCFVCGPGRSAHDGLEIFAGPISDRSLYACVWNPAADMLGEDGNVRSEIIWSALDCPGYFAAMGEELLPAVLGELVGEIYGEVPGGQPLVVYAWPLGQEGRKFYAGTAIATEQGDIVAASRSTWIHLQN